MDMRLTSFPGRLFRPVPEVREKFGQGFRQMAALLLMSVLIAFGVNHWRVDSIALVGNWSVDTRFTEAAGESLLISLDQAVQLFQKGEVLFLDARSQSQCAEGRIKEALCLPWQEVDHYFMKMAGRLDGAGVIITYCDGENCDLSHELALFLKKAGFKDVFVLVNGWTLWRQAGLPTVGKGAL